MIGLGICLVVLGVFVGYYIGTNEGKH
jgi:hypothetical protein